MALEEKLTTKLSAEIAMLKKETNRAVKLASKEEKKKVNKLIKDAEKQSKGAIKLDERGAQSQIDLAESKELLGDWIEQEQLIGDRLKHIRDILGHPTGMESIPDLPQLNGYLFPSELARTMTKELAKRKKTTTGPLAPYVNALVGYANLYRSVRATADDSAVGIHGLLAAYTNPNATKEAFGQHIQAWFVNGDKLLGKAISDYNMEALKKGTLTSEDWAREGLRIGGEETEFFLKGMGGNLQKAPIIKQANRAFGFYGDKLRLEWAEDFLLEQLRAGKTIDELRRTGKLREIAEGTNTATGWSNETFGGTLGELLLFAPRFLQSRLNNLGRASIAMVTDPLGSVEAIPGVGSKMRQGLEGKGVRDISLEKRLARKSMLRFLSGASTLTFFINKSLGNDTDLDVLKKDRNGDWTYNSNFMRIRLGGRDYSLLGTYDSLFRMLITSGGVLPNVSGSPLDALRGMGSGPVSTLWDGLTGEDFMGREIGADWIPGENEYMERMTYLLQEHVPFSLTDAPNIFGLAKEGEYGHAALLAGGEFFGMKSSPLGFNDWIYEISEEYREENKKSPTALENKIGWDPENLSKGEYRTIANDPRLVKYTEAMNIKKEGVSAAFEELNLNFQTIEKPLSDMLAMEEERRPPLGEIGGAIRALKKNRSVVFMLFEGNEDNVEAIKKIEDWEPNNRADYYGDKFWNRELEIDEQTRYEDWTKFEKEGKAILDEAFKEGGQTYLDYVLNPSGPNQQNYRSERFTDPKVKNVVEEFEADQKITKIYHQISNTVFIEGTEAHNRYWI